MKILEKTERRLGEKLFLKGDRCIGPKCAMVRRAYPPGAHGKKRSRRRDSSEFGSLLREKQKVRFTYGLDDRDVKRYAQKAAAARGVFSVTFMRLLESRLDNVVFRLGFVSSRHLARQLVSHGHVTVHSRTVTIPSYQVRKGDMVAIKERMLGTPLFSELGTRLKKHTPPAWLTLDRERRIGMVTTEVMPEGNEMLMDTMKIKEFYFR